MYNCIYYGFPRNKLKIPGKFLQQKLLGTISNTGHFKCHWLFIFSIFLIRIIWRIHYCAIITSPALGFFSKYQFVAFHVLLKRSNSTQKWKCSDWKFKNNFWNLKQIMIITVRNTILMSAVGFHGKSRFTFPGIWEIKNLFPGNPGIPDENFCFISIKISNI